MTFGPCDSRLGSLEGALIEWYDNRHPWKLRVPERQRSISAGWVTELTSDDGEKLLTADEQWTVDVQRDVLTEHAREGGEFLPDGNPPRPSAYLTAALKQAYLAACTAIVAAAFGAVRHLPGAERRWLTWRPMTSGSTRGRSGPACSSAPAFLAGTEAWYRLRH